MANILVVDDDQAIRQAVRKTLERRGHAVTEAADGAEGVKRFEADRPDIVITDVYMPGADGMEGVIRIMGAYPDARVIVMSGGGWDDTDHILKKAEALGASATLRKPFSVPELLQVVHDVLGASND